MTRWMLVVLVVGCRVRALPVPGRKNRVVGGPPSQVRVTRAGAYSPCKVLQGPSRIFQAMVNELPSLREAQNPKGLSL